MNRRIARTAQVGALFLALVLVPVALAAKGHGGNTGTGGSSSISAPVMVTDILTAGLSYGDTVTFNVSTTAADQPFVDVQCLQNGAVVYNTSLGFFPGALNTSYNFTLSSGMWTGGAANCTAYLQVSSRRGWSTLASTGFSPSA
jgi:hypothetical protein